MKVTSHLNVPINLTEGQTRLMQGFIRAENQMNGVTAELMATQTVLCHQYCPWLARYM